jgi:hypothetical protein
MNRSIHLLVCISSHGWGHLAQTVPIVAALRSRLPGLHITVRTGLDADVVRERFSAVGQPAPDVLPDRSDFGFEMHDAITIDDERSIARYAALHADATWLDRERDSLRALGVDAVIANIGYMPLAAAASLGLPAFGVSSLNWADVLASRAQGRADVMAIAGSMRQAYAMADRLFALVPGMPFDGFERRVRVAPIARRGRADRAGLRKALGVAATQQIMMVAFGGLPMAFDTASWHLPEGWSAVMLTQGTVETPTVIAAERLGWDYIDLLASCDLLVAKPGYGTFAEAGFASRDTLAVPRDDWPEAPWLIDWLAQHARCATIALPDLRAGRFEAGLSALAMQPERTAADGDGAAEIADQIVSIIAGRQTRDTPPTP